MGDLGRFLHYMKKALLISYRTQEIVEKKISKEPIFMHLTIGNRP